MATKIMVCDDSAIVRQQVSWALVEAGYEVLEAVDGQDAHEKIAATPGISLLVCDVNMPRMDGLSAPREDRRVDAEAALSGSHADDRRPTGAHCCARRCWAPEDGS